jgi:glycosyltransferase involved in cell wall biosynthesis
LRNDASGDVPFPELFERAGVPYFAVPMKRAVRPLSDCLALLTIYRHIKRERFDIVHAHSSKAGVLARIAARAAGVPVVLYSPHAFSFAGPKKTIVTRAYVYIERAAARLCDGIIVDSRGERDLALERRICRPEKIRVIPPGLEPTGESVDEGPGNRSQILERLAISNKHRIVTFIGRLAAQKDPLSFIRCARLVGDAHERVTFLVVGDGPLRDHCRAAVKENDLNGRMRLLGWRRDYREILAVSDVLVLCSLYEGLPFILLEGMAQGKPIVATEVTGIREVLTNGVDGFLVPPHAPERLARACLHILENEAEQGRIGSAARAKAVQEFRVERCASLTEETYSDLLDRHSS